MAFITQHQPAAKPIDFKLEYYYSSKTFNSYDFCGSTNISEMNLKKKTFSRKHDIRAIKNIIKIQQLFNQFTKPFFLHRCNK
jgi:hypothetical protein